MSNRAAKPAAAKADPLPEREDPATPPVEAAPGREFPLPVYNPVVPHERFKVDGRGGWVRFVGGRFVAPSADALDAALACLAYHRRAGDPAAFVGDDRKEWCCKEPRCGFCTRNEAAKDAHETIGHS